MLEYADRVEAEWRKSAEPIRSAALRDDLVELQERIGEVGGVRLPHVTAVDDVDGAREQLDVAFRFITETLKVARLGAQQRSSLIDLLVDLRDLAARVEAEHEAGRATALARVREAMASLRGVSTVEQMLERGPAAAAHLGFDRTFVSAIKDAYFVPHTCFVEGDREWAEAIVRAGREAPRRLDRNLLETEIVRRRQPIWVRDAQHDPRVHREIAEVSMSRSYVAAPVVVQDRVIGFMHADYYEQRRLASRSDADLLWMFCEAFGFAFERIAAGEQISALRQSFLRAMADTQTRFAQICESELSFEPSFEQADTVDEPRRSSVPAAAAGHDGGRSELGDLLTKRELEVLRLMAEGATNDGIAQRLVISHGTAKTHVKHILRKLRAANRAEAVSRYFQLLHSDHAI